MRIVLLYLGPSEGNGDDEPTPADLAAIEHESALIAAEVRLLDAEIAILASEHGPTPLDLRRLRRARHQVIREAAALLADPRLVRRVA